MTTQWEYDISPLEGEEYNDPAFLKESLEIWGREGWELACAMELVAEASHVPLQHVILKRQRS